MLWRVQRVWLNVIEYGEYDGYTWSFAEEYDVQMYIRVALHQKLKIPKLSPKKRKMSMLAKCLARVVALEIPQNIPKMMKMS